MPPSHRVSSQLSASAACIAIIRVQTARPARLVPQRVTDPLSCFFCLVNWSSIFMRLHISVSRFNMIPKASFLFVLRIRAPNTCQEQIQVRPIRYVRYFCEVPMNLVCHTPWLPWTLRCETFRLFKESRAVTSEDSAHDPLLTTQGIQASQLG